MQKITWRTLFNETKPFRKKILFGQLVALIAVLISLPIPLLFPLMIDQVLLEKPAWLVGKMDVLFSPDEPYLYIIIVLCTTLTLRL